jgi:hypothetical protein
VLVDLTRSHTLLLIQVKPHARLSDLRLTGDLVDELLEYRDLIREVDPIWTARPVIIAAQIDANVLQRARDAAIDVWRHDTTTQRLTAVAGYYD